MHRVLQSTKSFLFKGPMVKARPNWICFCQRPCLVMVKVGLLDALLLSTMHLIPFDSSAF